MIADDSIQFLLSQLVVIFGANQAKMCKSIDDRLLIEGANKHLVMFSKRPFHHQ